MVQERTHNIERARNVIDLGCLGDPERWGGTAEVSIPVADLVPTDLAAVSQQMVRAQTADMISRAWDLLCYWSVTGLDVPDTYEMSLEVRSGSGQSGGTGRILLGPALVTSPPTWWQVVGATGTLHLPQPIPASAISVRGRLHVISLGGVGDHNVTGQFTCMIAPRAL